MHSRTRAALLAIVLAAAAAAACGMPSPLGPDYEYEEDLTLSMDGSATLDVNASVLALDALKGLTLPPDVNARTDDLRDRVRALYESPYAGVGRISTWTRRGHRFVGIRLTVPDIRALPKAPQFAWAKYALSPDGELVAFRETLSKPPPPGVTLPPWRGDELVAFRVHLPARIRFQNSRYLDGGGTRPASRGNIVTWEQRLQQRIEGKPIAYAEDRTPDVMEVRMDRESILYRTLWLFGIAFAAALLVLAGLIWLTMRRGRDEVSRPQ
ncbi:MAG TPA: hypothetical protein VGI12_03560 [Vicinamibacterales bacterium]|jgi:hypothetical protein